MLLAGVAGVKLTPEGSQINPGRGLKRGGTYTCAVEGTAADHRANRFPLPIGLQPIQRIRAILLGIIVFTLIGLEKLFTHSVVITLLDDAQRNQLVSVYLQCGGVFGNQLIPSGGVGGVMKGRG